MLWSEYDSVGEWPFRAAMAGKLESPAVAGLMMSLTDPSLGQKKATQGHHIGTNVVIFNTMTLFANHVLPSPTKWHG